MSMEAGKETVIKSTFDKEVAEGFLGMLFQESVQPIAVEKVENVVNQATGFPYLAIYMSPDTADNMQALDNKKLVDALLNEGYGLVVYVKKDKEEPVWSYRYADILCYKIFK
ncbi:MAG: hypothetical protein WAO98_07960, partial [Alphaproteobacteria bacterium]